MLEDCPGAASLSTSHHLEATGHDILGITVGKAQKGTTRRSFRGAVRRGLESGSSASVQPLRAQSRGDGRVNRLVERRARPSPGMVGGQDDGVSQLVIVPDRSSSGGAANQRNPLPARLSQGLAQALEISQGECGFEPTVGTQEHDIGPASDPLQERRIQRHVRRTAGDRVWYLVARNGHVDPLEQGQGSPAIAGGLCVCFMMTGRSTAGKRAGPDRACRCPRFRMDLGSRRIFRRIPRPDSMSGNLPRWA